MRRSIKMLLAASTALGFAASAVKLSLAGPSAREWKAPSTPSERKNPIPVDQRSMAAGRAVYDRECASCHGISGKGDGKDGMDLEPRPADLSSPAVAGQSDGALFWKVSVGRRPMPGFRKDLTEDERWQVVNFIRTLAPRK